MRVVLDASSVLAMLLGEPVTDDVDAAIDEGCFMSAVNMAEVATKLHRRWHGGLASGVADQFNLAVVPLTEDIALRAGALEPVTRRLGLSLADRCCLATCEAIDAIALTTDRAWLELPAAWSARIRVVRPVT